MKMRKSKRFPASSRAELHCDGDVFNIGFNDVSCEGARLYGVDRLPTGAAMEIRLAHLSLLAHVTWCRGARCGVSFDQPLSQHDLGVIRQKRTRDKRHQSGWRTHGNFRELR